jgi:hypothetical protein
MAMQRSACSFGWWLIAGGWFVLREKYCWLVAEKPSEQCAYLLRNSFNVSVHRSYMGAREQ